jgi:hypothetical protein
MTTNNNNKNNGILAAKLCFSVQFSDKKLSDCREIRMKIDWLIVSCFTSTGKYLKPLDPLDFVLSMCNAILLSLCRYINIVALYCIVINKPFSLLLKQWFWNSEEHK